MRNPVFLCSGNYFRVKRVEVDGALGFHQLIKGGRGNIFSAGKTSIIEQVLKKLMAVRIHRRNVTVDGTKPAATKEMLTSLNMTTDIADSIYRLTSLAKFTERFVIPDAHREEAIEMLEHTSDVKGSTGFGFREKPERGL